MAFYELLLLGLIAGGTIFLGLPIARMRNVSPKLMGMLNAAAAGILLFLLVDVMGDAFGATEEKVLGALSGAASAQAAALHLLLLIGGVAAGLLSLVWFEQRYLPAEAEMTSGMNRAKATRIAMMIAIGIGLHNFAEGLAIGQSYASGAISLALLLVVGFGLHNATEGFGIAAPLSGFKPSWKLLLKMGLIGGGPTFIGAIAGSFWVSEEASLLFLALAAGAIIYVIKELLYHGRTRGEGIAAMASLAAGFFAGFCTDLVIKLASG